MDANVSEFSHIGDILVLPLFEGTEKAPIFNKPLAATSWRHKGMGKGFLLHLGF